MSDFAKHRLIYAVVDESGQVIAATATRWTADRLIEGIKAYGDATSLIGKWHVVRIEGDTHKAKSQAKGNRE